MTLKIGIMLAMPLLLVGQTGTLTVATYNLLNFSGGSSSRVEFIKTVLQEIAPDILVAQEIASQSGADLVLNDILRSFSLDYEAGTFVDKGSQNNAVFYRRDKVFLESYITLRTDLRDINGYQFSIMDHADSTFRWTLFSAHLKASSGPTNEQRRWLEAAKLKFYVSTKDSNFHYAFAGDFNLYDAAEPAYTLLMDSMSVPLVDPEDARGNWHNNSTYASIHTQSTRSGREPDGGASGGVDDRFDFILLSHQSIGAEYPISYIEGTYQSYGNDGQHFNRNINDSPENQGIPRGMADALFGASDHLPVTLQLAYPATGNTVDIIAHAGHTPSTPYLIANYPNPFNSSTVIHYVIPTNMRHSVTVHNILGRKIVNLRAYSTQGGVNQVVWDGRNGTGQDAAAGQYIVRLLTDEGSETIKIVLLK